MDVPPHSKNPIRLNIFNEFKFEVCCCMDLDGERRWCLHTAPIHPQDQKRLQTTISVTIAKFMEEQSINKLHINQETNDICDTDTGESNGILRYFLEIEKVILIKSRNALTPTSVSLKMLQF